VALLQPLFKIENFEENVKHGSLMIIDFKPFFEAARNGDPSILTSSRHSYKRC
jgi:hypothetical protein